MRFIFSALIVFLFLCEAKSQPYFPAGSHVYNDSVVPRIDIFMDADSLAIMYNDLYTETEYTATFVFNDGTTIDTVDNIGIRIRGNTSQVSQKKSFKIDFNHFVPGRKFYGLQQLHLNGEHNDPCITRSKLYWDILESMHVPGPRANHAEVYINGNYYGLYVDVENIDENFVKSRFGTNYGNLYKCLWPADLHYISNNPDDYKLVVSDRRVYELETNTDADDYSDLADFISMLKFTSDADFPTELEKKFDVNSFLRAYAVDVATGNWDDYAYNQNNYYLYHNPVTGKFEYIVYDTDNTFGIDWFNIDWGIRNIYNWGNNGLNLPLLQRIFAVPEYVSRFTFFTEQLQAGLFDTANVFPKIDSILQQISPFVVNDPYHSLDYGWDYNDFVNSYTEAPGLHVKYGLKPYFTTRHDETQIELQSTNVIPVISNVNQFPLTVLPGDSVFISAWVQDELVPVSITLNYQVNNGSLNSISMIDDGLHRDGIAGDEIYGAIIPSVSTFDTIRYFITATDVNAQTGREPREDTYSFVALPPPHLVFNELMASNTAAVPDEYGEYDDWLEVYNVDTVAVFLGDKFLTDEPGNIDKWRMPHITLSPHGFILIWCDNQTNEGDHHSNFKLNADSEQVMLYEENGTQNILLDSLAFAHQVTDVSIGCFPDGVLPIIPLASPTPGYSNTNLGIDTFNGMVLSTVFPNPFDDHLTLQLVTPDLLALHFSLFDEVGKQIYSGDEELAGGTHMISFDKFSTQLHSGIYLLELSGNAGTQHFFTVKKLVKE